MIKTKTTFSAFTLLPVLAVAIFSAGCSHKAAGGGGGGGQGGGKMMGPPPVLVQVAPVRLGNIVQTQGVTGNIEALEDSTVSAQVAGRITAVYVREGDNVKAGQVLVQQDTSALQANVDKDQANVANAESTLAQSITNYQIQVVQARQNVQNAQDAVRAAEFNYSKEKQGSRPPQILEAKSAVEQAQANAQNAASELKRDQYLYSQGALDAADYQTAQTTYTVDEQQLKNAQAALSLTIQGNYAQDISAAQEAVKEAQTTLVNQIANEKQILLHKQQIQAAQAGVAAAKATLAFDQQQVGFATIHAPFSGIIASRTAQPGVVASAGTALLEIINVSTCYFQPTISQEFFTSVHIGTSVSVRCDALPGKVFPGIVAAVYPSTDTSTRVFTLRVDIPDPNNDLRPGMFARGELVTASYKNVVVIPISALMAQSQSGMSVNTTSTGSASGNTTMPNQQVMLLGPGDKAIAQPVTVGAVTGTQAQIVSGLSPGQTVITTGGGLAQPGSKVRVQGQAHQGSHRFGGQSA